MIRRGKNLLLSKDLGYVKADINDGLMEACDRIMMMLTKLYNSL